MLQFLVEEAVGDRIDKEEKGERDMRKCGICTSDEKTKSVDCFKWTGGGDKNNSTFYS